jgi:hypothetical protein
MQPASPLHHFNKNDDHEIQQVSVYQFASITVLVAVSKPKVKS